MVPYLDRILSIKFSVSKLVSLLSILLALLAWFWVRGDRRHRFDRDIELSCWKNSRAALELCQPICGNKFFSLPNMNFCYSWLDCNQIYKEVTIRDIIGTGVVKLVRYGVWREQPVAVNQLINTVFREDFQHGLRMLISLQASSVPVTELVGFCVENNIFVTRHYPLGSAANLESILGQENFSKWNSVKFRFGLCVQYAGIIHALHTSPIGTRVMCDSNDPAKALSQFLLREDLALILNDVDALPEVDKSQGQLIKCGHQELFGDFVAPEQHWPFSDRDYNDEEMPSYDEKVDIWKIPDVCNHLLGDCQGSSRLRLQLLSVHIECKQVEPSKRPNAENILKQYMDVMESLKDQPCF